MYLQVDYDMWSLPYGWWQNLFNIDWGEKWTSGLCRTSGGLSRSFSIFFRVLY